MNKEEAIKILNDYMGGKIDPEKPRTRHNGEEIKCTKNMIP